MKIEKKIFVAHLPGKRIVCPVCLTEIRQENVPAGTFFNTYCTGCGMDAGENVLHVTTREGLLWNGQEQIDLPLADEVQFYGADVGEPGVLHVAGKAWTSVIMPKGKADDKPKAGDTKASGAASAAKATAPVEAKPAAAKATGAASKAEASKPEPVAATK